MTFAKHLIAKAACAAAFFYGVPACAQDGFVNVYSVGLGTSANALGNLHAHQNLNRYIHHWDSPSPAAGKGASPSAGRRPSEPLLVPLPLRAEAATEMAATLPAAQRAQAESAFRQALQVHGQVLAKFGVPENDLAGAFAAYLAGAWMAFHNASFPDSRFPPLVKQMRQVLAGSERFASTSPADRRVLHERLAIVGVLLASSQVSYASNPKAAAATQLAANMQRDGRAALEQMLGVSADRVRFGDNGLQLQ